MTLPINLFFFQKLTNAPAFNSRIEICYSSCLFLFCLQAKIKNCAVYSENGNYSIEKKLRELLFLHLRRLKFGRRISFYWSMPTFFCINLLRFGLPLILKILLRNLQTEEFANLILHVDMSYQGFFSCSAVSYYLIVPLML